MSAKSQKTQENCPKLPDPSKDHQPQDMPRRGINDPGSPHLEKLDPPNLQLQCNPTDSIGSEIVLPTPNIPLPNKRRGRPKSNGAGKKRRSLTPYEKCQATKLLISGAPVRAVARALKTSTSTINTQVRDLIATLPSQEDIKLFQQQKHQVIEGSMLKLFKSINNDDKHKRASLQNLAYAAKQIHTIQRLENGQSTANVSTQVTHLSAECGKLTPDN